ncbi:hypothetical protein CYMTET_29568 [Cymbomonas tetramitiformis]|uniref:Uncharacterized protein n=1 Tax=Cymbomonas tetramitiformis TaxID=36881 RepID=A0AAE0KUT3_9CHLO|nr:hypothetical protein CYMTET_29568 [Cymbomonas tetramitiformis]|eukprot:gene15951-18910_t
MAQKSAAAASDADRYGNAKRRWDANMQKLEKGILYIWTNQLEEAEHMFLVGMGSEEAVADDVVPDFAPAEAAADEATTHAADTGETADDSLERRDLRGCFGLMYSFVGLIRGIASMENNQLEEAIKRLQRTEKLTAHDTNWIGRKVVRGLACLLGGLVMCLQRELLKGVWNILSSWQYIKCFKAEALTYTGVGHEVVRSAALQTIGIFNIILSLLPQSMIRTASYLSGLDCDFAAGLAMVTKCYKEEGICAPFAASAMLAYRLDLSTFLGHVQSEEDLSTCKEIIDWANRRYPGSFLFSDKESLYWATRRDLHAALGCVERAAVLPCLKELPAFRWLMLYRQSIFWCARLGWGEAGPLFEAAMTVYVEAKRRAMVPCMAVHALLCYSLAGDQPSADRMLSVLEEHRRGSKKNWGRQDTLAFEKCEELQGSRGTPRAEVLPLMESMMFLFRLAGWMQPQHSAELHALLQRVSEAGASEERVRAAACRAEAYRQQEQMQQASGICMEALPLTTNCKGLAAEVAAARLHLTFAQVHAEMGNSLHGLVALQGLSKMKGYAAQKDLAFKSTMLKQRLELQVVSQYTGLKLSPGKQEIIEVYLDAGETAEWDWVVQAQSVEFWATFCPAANQRESVQVAPKSVHDSSTGVVSGRLPKALVTSGGLLKLCWCNASYMNLGRVVTYRVNCVVTNPEQSGTYSAHQQLDADEHLITEEKHAPACALDPASPLTGASAAHSSVELFEATRTGLNKSPISLEICENLSDGSETYSRDLEPCDSLPSAYEVPWSFTQSGSIALDGLHGECASDSSGDTDYDSASDFGEGNQNAFEFTESSASTDEKV